MPFTFNFGNFGGFNPGGYQTGGQGPQPDFTQRPQKERKPRKPIGTPFTRTLINLAVTLPAAYALSRRDFVGRKFFTLMFLFTMFFSGGLIPTFLTVKSLGLYNNPWVMVILGATSMTNIIISRTFFETNIPNELREAAEIDGCSNTRFFFSIVLPLSTAIIAVMALFFAVTHWNGYLRR